MSSGDSALSLIHGYGSSDSDSDTELGDDNKSRRAKRRLSAGPSWKKSEGNKMIKSESKRLELPDGIAGLFTDKQSKWVDDKHKHEGRSRSFEHQAGNWATFVHIPVPPSDDFYDLCTALVHALPTDIPMKLMDDFHVSLSRTVVLQHHWINSFIEALRQCFIDCSSFTLVLETLEFYTNDEKTRSFLGLKVSIGHDYLLELVKLVDECLLEFRLPIFYEKPSFHVSIAWCLGNMRAKVTKDLTNDLKRLFDDFIDQNPAIDRVEVKEIQCNSGNKHFSFPLS
ncbi:U6 snRNA phosphodiesterase 1-like [Saccoglossus kowalevskii]|uniref:U6 snRNA phosphodiesterase n=1 Tax=Saccoglossus kowalevskii TaxID=10224 RepID=A0ABM0GWS1_SACKO|nr:PREDICTED: U6 snRNA phosphodiesterase-like [Saccoglossus kowalevskii]